MSIKIQYFVAGFLFGCCFPVAAMVFELLRNKLGFDFTQIAIIHQHNPMLYMIDSAPVFLGLFALIGGYSKQRSVELLDSIQQTSLTLSGLSNDLSHVSSHSFLELDKGNQQFQHSSESLFSAAKSKNEFIGRARSESFQLKEKSDEVLQQLQIIVEFQSSKKKHNQSLYQSILDFMNEVDGYKTHITNIIDIAKQVNVMAINTSIEANKLGAQGRGFGMIAQNIKKLAEETDSISIDLRDKSANLHKKIRSIYLRIENEYHDLENSEKKILNVKNDMHNCQHFVSQLNQQLNQLEAFNESHYNDFILLRDQFQTLTQSTHSVIERLNTLIAKEHELVSTLHP